MRCPDVIDRYSVGSLGLAAFFRRVRGDPWLLAALAGVSLHSFVEFGMQVPAIVMLFVVLAAMCPAVAPRAESNAPDQVDAPGPDAHGVPS